MIKAQCRNFKKNRILVCFSLLLSVILSMSAPFSITSNAQSLSLGVSNVDFASSLFTFLATFDVFSSILEDPLADPYSDTSIRKQITDLDIQNSYPLFADMNQYESGLGDEVKAAVIASALGGSWVIPQSLVSRVRAYLENEKTENSGVLTVGARSYDLPLTSANYVTTIRYNCSLFNETGYYYEVTITSPVPYLSVYQPGNTGYYHDQFCFVPSQSGVMTTSYTSNMVWNKPNVIENHSFNFVTSDNIQFQNNMARLSFDEYYYKVTSCEVHSEYGLPYISGTSFNDAVYKLKTTGTALGTSTIDATIGDIDQDILSDGSTVDTDGSVAGKLVFPVASFDKLQAIINNIESGILSIDEAVNLLGVARVDPDATQSEKESVISDLVSTYPYVDSADYGSISISESSSKVNTFTHIEHSIANALASIMGKALPYPDEDPDYVPPGNPHIEDWSFPSLDPNNPNPGGSGNGSSEDQNRVADVANGISVVAGIGSDIFDSASGFNLVTMVGFSFVIFSAILGASHFFGALGGRHDDVKSHPLDWNRSERWSNKRTDFKSDW